MTILKNWKRWWNGEKRAYFLVLGGLCRAGVVQTCAAKSQGLAFCAECLCIHKSLTPQPLCLPIYSHLSVWGWPLQVKP